MESDRQEIENDNPPNEVDELTKEQTQTLGESPMSADRQLGAEEWDNPKTRELSSQFVGRWSQLISTTNWEKGRIIAEWRQALMGSESPSTSYSDEAWARRVGGVTAQHVGRLRRVYERFHDEYETYQGLYWSHFLAALDWDDAEMWLEGAVQSNWSVSQMRRTRWEANGGDPSQRPEDADLTVVTEDEDYTPLAEADGSRDSRDGEAGVQDGARQVAEGPRPDGPDFGEESYDSPPDGEQLGENEVLPWQDDPGPQDSPFANLPSLPVDLADALEAFKLAIIRHRADEWAEVEQADVMRAIEALRVFAMR